jgi:spore germination protein YaaH
MNTFRLFVCTLFIVAVIPATALAQTSGCVTFSGDLVYGATGSEVTTLQTFLKSQGYFSAAPVARFGPATLTAVRAFQRAQGISATGTVGPLTRAAIRSASCLPGQGNTPGASTGAPLEVTGWIPYWRSATGTADVLPNLSKLTEVNPFVYTLKSDGTFLDNGKLNEEPWLSFIAAAKAQKVRVIPTIMTSNSELLHNILSDQKKRIALEDTIAALVKENNFDGIDIDFEGKRAEDKDNFSTFLKGLYQRMGQKWVMCTIESRTPLDSRYYGTDVPQDATTYANDLKEINKYCDRVRIMAYDQQGIDLKLSAQAASSSQLYAPVADPAWVEKVVNLMAKDIKRSKILIGVPTYGYEYDVTAYANNEYVYKILWTFNPGYAWPLAQQYGITPQRNASGEMYFTYVNAATSSAPVSLGAESAKLAAAAASQYATAYNSHVDFRLVEWPDAQSLQTKIDLARKLGVRGVSIFKFDGGEDPAVWDVLTGVKR